MVSFLQSVFIPPTLFLSFFISIKQIAEKLQAIQSPRSEYCHEIAREYLSGIGGTSSLVTIDFDRAKDFKLTAHTIWSIEQLVILGISNQKLKVLMCSGSSIRTWLLAKANVTGNVKLRVRTSCKFFTVYLQIPNTAKT